MPTLEQIHETLTSLKAASPFAFVLAALAGLLLIRAQAHNQRIEVLFDTAVLNPDAIAERIAKAGYQTRVVSSTSDSGS